MNRLKSLLLGDNLFRSHRPIVRRYLQGLSVFVSLAVHLIAKSLPLGLDTCVFDSIYSNKSRASAEAVDSGVN